MPLSASIIIRTLNEARWLPALLGTIRTQDFPGNVEIVLVDSGSTDGTMEIAAAHNCRIVTIRKEEFTFGRSLNIGCNAAKNEHLVFISGHCIPVHGDWLRRLILPLAEGTAYAYGRQIGHATTKFSERQVFAKYFPASVTAAPGGIFCHNANAALRTDVWARHPFDEDLTGLEDMELAKRLIRDGEIVAYVPEAAVYHIHDESWRKIQLRYEREAIALQKIMPEIHISFGDFLRYFASGVLHDAGEALEKKTLLKTLPEIAIFRLLQYWGAYRGNRDHTRLSRARKEQYFYPKANNKL
jgi:glycosyltransferase involved in cell wall biosynthesis